MFLNIYTISSFISLKTVIPNPDIYLKYKIVQYALCILQ